MTIPVYTMTTSFNQLSTLSNEGYYHEHAIREAAGTVRTRCILRKSKEFG